MPFRTFHCMGGRPRVLFATVDLTPGSGGISRVARSVTRFLARKSHSQQLHVRIECLFGPETLNDGSWPHVVHYRAHFGNRTTFSAAVSWFGMMWADVLVFDHIGPGSLLSVMPCPFRPRSAIFLHDSESWGPMPWRKKRAMDIADLLICNSEYTARKVAEVRPHLMTLSVCHLGIPSESSRGEFLTRILERFGSKYVLIVGRMEPGQRYKGHDELIEVMPNVEREAPGAKLVVVGKGKDLPRLRKKAARICPEGSVVFVGHVPDSDLAAYYEGCRVFAMPSTGEGFGLVFLEAMRAGKPCIGWSDGPAPEIIENGKTGLLVDPNRKEDLTGALLRLLKDDELCRDMGRRAKQRFNKHFTEAHFETRFWKAISPLIWGAK